MGIEVEADRIEALEEIRKHDAQLVNCNVLGCYGRGFVKTIARHGECNKCKGTGQIPRERSYCV
jgi:hypothetical protein